MIPMTKLVNLTKLEDIFKSKFIQVNSENIIWFIIKSIILSNFFNKLEILLFKSLLNSEFK